MEEKVPKDAQVSSKSNGKTSSVEKVKLIRHFTSVEKLCLILQDGFRMGDTQKWKDKNDSYGIQRYAELQNGQNVLVLCFCATKGNVYHWNSLKKKSTQTSENQTKTEKYTDLMCSIDIKKEEFFSYVKSLNGFQAPKSVIYCKNAKVLEQSKDNLPYLKRAEYHIEKEIRILYIGSQTNSKEKIYIPNIKDYIAHITIDSSNLQLYKIAKKTLVEKFNIDKSKIRGNGFSNSKVWQRNINTLNNQ